MDLAADGRELAHWTAYAETDLTDIDPPTVFLAKGAEPYADGVASIWEDDDSIDAESELHTRTLYVIVAGPDATGDNSDAQVLELGSYRSKVSFDTGTEIIVRPTDTIDVAEVP